MDDLIWFCWLNTDCPDHGKWNYGNRTVPAHHGPNRTRVLRDRMCKVRFSERKGTPLSDARLPANQVVAVLVHEAKGVGPRKTARLTGGTRIP
ncbi:hypothetical protein GobsT_48780 [Gemmata obscuriglobus]|uniref:hypothetical protein n=1 Tax=Gemmata obscuriglobus TaxID=114 RepID=UPI00016C56B5|nr:hypothetical protein [Gemmata obscuriglobus]QEG30078.1 hypothetical protein GobsT_48780 [Gemmata obscuriglobus]VTS09399.1 Marine sediment metagenome DNA, contig: S01H1_L04904 OS=marine sediment metagenome GN=S01H1_13053 PE=4 SV=1 [Gemmata obscuriglobus UQM 2246]